MPRLNQILNRVNAPLNQSELDVLSPMLDATEWPNSYMVQISLVASQEPCGNIIPIRGANASSSSKYNASFLFDREAVSNTADMLWKEAVMAGAADSQIWGKVQMMKEGAVTMGPSSDGTLRSPANNHTCISEKHHMEFGEGFGGQYLYSRLLMQYAAVHNMWYCHHRIHKFGPHTKGTNVPLGSELMGFQSVKDPKICLSCRCPSKAAIVAHWSRRLGSPNKEWLRLDGVLRLRLYSSVARMQWEGLALSTCKCMR